MMNDRVKNALGIAAALGVLMLGFAAVKYVKVYSKSIEPSAYRSFAVTGEGKAVAVPDVAQVSFTVVTEGGTDLAKLQKENIEKANRAIAFVKEKGVDSKDVKTESYNVSPRYTTYNCYPRILEPGAGAPVPVECPPSKIAGYTITQTVSVKIRKFELVGDILSGVVEQGANQVHGPNFVVDDLTAVQNEARKEAIKNAKERAAQIAEAGGFSIGRLLGIDDGGYPIPYYDKLGRGGALEMAALPSASVSPTIEPGSQDVRVSVVLRYEIR
jgi:uncharacterized protein YggE